MEIKCPACGAEMKCIAKKNNGITGGGSKYRRRLFQCTVCDHIDLIHGDGNHDVNDNRNFDHVPVKKQRIDLSEIPSDDIDA